MSEVNTVSEVTTIMSFSDVYTFTGIVVITISAIVGIPLWITGRFKTLRDEMFKRLSENKESCVSVRERVSILETKEQAHVQKLNAVEKKVDRVTDLMNEMKLTSLAHHNDILKAIVGKGGS